MTTCVFPGETLSAYLDDELSPQERVDSEIHVASCEVCRQTLSAWRTLAGLVEAKHHSDSDVTVATMRRRLRRRSSKRVGVAGAAAAVVLMASAFVADRSAPRTFLSEGEDVAPVAPPALSAEQPVAPPISDRGDGLVAVPPGIPGSMDTASAADTWGPSADEVPIAFTTGSNEVFHLSMRVAAEGQEGSAVRFELRLQNTTSDRYEIETPREAAIEVEFRDGSGSVVLARSRVESWSGETTIRAIEPHEGFDELVWLDLPAAGKYRVIARCECTTVADPGPPLLGSSEPQFGPFETKPIDVRVRATPVYPASVP